MHSYYPLCVWLDQQTNSFWWEVLNKRRIVTLAITFTIIQAYTQTQTHTNTHRRAHRRRRAHTHTRGTHRWHRHIHWHTYIQRHTCKHTHTWIQTNTHTPKYPHTETNTSGKTYMITCNTKSYFHSLIRFLWRAKSQYEIMLESAYLWIWMTASYWCLWYSLVTEPPP